MTAHVLERFICCSFIFPRLLIDNKQARCFSFEFRPFDLSPRKLHGMVHVFSFDQRDCVYTLFFIRILFIRILRLEFAKF